MGWVEERKGGWGGVGWGVGEREGEEAYLCEETFFG